MSGLEEIPLVPIKTAVVWMVVLQIYQNYNKKLTYYSNQSLCRASNMNYFCFLVNSSALNQSHKCKSEELRSRKSLFFNKFLLSALCSFVFVLVMAGIMGQQP